MFTAYYAVCRVGQATTPAHHSLDLVGQATAPAHHSLDLVGQTTAPAHLGLRQKKHSACSSLARICSIWNDHNVSPLPQFVCVSAHSIMMQLRRKRIGGEGRVRGLCSHSVRPADPLIRPVGHLLPRFRGRRNFAKRFCSNVEENPDKSTGSNTTTSAQPSPTLQIHKFAWASKFCRFIAKALFGKRRTLLSWQSGCLHRSEKRGRPENASRSN